MTNIILAFDEPDDMPWLYVHEEYPNVPVEECARIFWEEYTKQPKRPGEDGMEMMERSHRISNAVVARVSRWKPS